MCGRDLHTISTWPRIDAAVQYPTNPRNLMRGRLLFSVHVYAWICASISVELTHCLPLQSEGYDSDSGPVKDEDEQTDPNSGPLMDEDEHIDPNELSAKDELSLLLPRDRPEHNRLKEIGVDLKKLCCSSCGVEFGKSISETGVCVYACRTRHHNGACLSPLPPPPHPPRMYRRVHIRMPRLRAGVLVEPLRPNCDVTGRVFVRAHTGLWEGDHLCKPCLRRWHISGIVCLSCRFCPFLKRTCTLKHLVYSGDHVCPRCCQISCVVLGKITKANHTTRPYVAF